MARTRNQLAAELDSKRRFAALFVNGSGRTRGDWDESNKVLGTEFRPNDDDLRRLIEEEGGEAPAKEASDIVVKAGTAAPIAEGDYIAVIPTVPEFTLPAPNAEREEWCKLWRDKLAPVFESIAMGGTRASAAQAKLLTSVQERCFGRVDVKTEEDVKSGVMLLPTIGVGSTMLICPRCGHTYEDNTD